MKQIAMKPGISAVVAVSLMLPSTALIPRLSAHHAFAAEYDSKKHVVLKGTVTKMEWINPHAWIHIEVKKPEGGVEEWMIEFGTPNTLLRRGFTHDSLKPGTEITVDGYQAKDSALRANGRNVTLPDGKVLFAGSPVADAPYKDPGK
jgi:Family of unknown function (DUF6152)